MKGLDKYLTQAPDSKFDDYCEELENSFSNYFYNYTYDENYDSKKTWYLNSLENKAFSKDINPKKAARLIERIVSLYKLYEKRQDKPVCPFCQRIKEEIELNIMGDCLKCYGHTLIDKE